MNEQLSDEERRELSWPAVNDARLVTIVERILAARLADANARLAAAPEQAIDLLTVLIADHPMWIGDDGRPLDYLPERESRITDLCREFAAALRPDPSQDPA